jgi:predicted lipoprotein
MQKLIKPILILISVLAVIFFSLKIENLEEYKAANTTKKFDASDYAAKFWAEQIPTIDENAIDASNLIQLLKEKPDEAFEKHSYVLGIAKTHYFMLKGRGKILSIEEEFVVLQINDTQSIQLATDFIFGNSVRDGSGKISINEFINMTDFNNVSVALNKLVKTTVVNQLRSVVEVGKIIEFVGATEINKEHIDIKNIRVIPVRAIVNNGENN